MPDNPYPFDNDAYQDARTGLTHYIDALWLAGASVEQIHDTVTARIDEIGERPDDSVSPTESPEVETPEVDEEAVAEEEGTATEEQSDEAVVAEVDSEPEESESDEEPTEADVDEEPTEADAEETPAEDNETPE